MTGNLQKIESGELRTLNFHGDEVITFERAGEQFVAMRRIVENMSIDWPTQRRKLLENEGKFSCGLIPSTGSDGKSYKMLCVPVRKLPLWLATINPNRITDPDKRAKIELYQEESAQALYAYWTTGVAVRDDLDGVVTGLDPAVMKALGGMFKGILGKALSETVPALVQKELSAGHLNVVSGITASQVLDMAGIRDRKGMRGLANRVSNQLRTYHIQKGVAMTRGSLGPINRILFDPATVREWLAEGGKYTIDRWINEKVEGQRQFKLVTDR